MSNFFESNQPSAGEPLQQGSLERLGINVETYIDEGILTASQAKAVHFRVSKPQGYAFQEVERFVEDIVTPSLEWYARTLHNRDLQVHQLGTLLDQAETDIKNLQAQLAFHQGNQPLKEALGRSADDAEAVALMARLTAAEEEAASLRAALAEAQAGAAATSNATPDQIKEYEDYINQITTQYNDLLAQYETDVAALNEQVAAAQTMSAGGDQAAELAALQQAYAELQTQYEAAAAQIAAGAATPSGENVDERVAQLEEYIEQVTKQYTELSEQYTTDVNALQQQLAAAQAGAPVATAAPSTDAETEAYINQITTQYEELAQNYTALQGEKEALEVQVANLQEQVKEYQVALAAAEEEDEEEDTPPPFSIPLLTEERKRDIDASKYKDLPPGIRPEDLE